MADRSTPATTRRPTHRRRPRASLLRRAASIATAIVLAAVALVQPATAYEEVRPASPDQGLWQFTGYGMPNNVGVHTNLKQNIVAWCTGDSQSGPYSTYPVGSEHDGNFRYTNTTKVEAGHTYIPASTSKGYVKGEGSPAWTGRDIDASETRVLSRHTPKVAYIMWKWGRDLKLRNDPGRAAALHWAMHEYTDAGSAALHFNIPGSRLTEANSYRTEANRLAGPYSSSPTLDINAGMQTGWVKDVEVLSAAGNRLGGYSYTLSLSGPAVFVLPDGGTSKAIHGTSHADFGRAHQIRSTGTGDITAKVVFTELPATGFEVLRDRDAQDLWVAGPKSTLTVETSPASMVGTFDPVLSARASTAYIDKGDPFRSLLQVRSNTSDPWLENASGLVGITVRGEVYGPYSSPQPYADAPPSSRNPVAEVNQWFKGPASRPVTTSERADKPGYYTWVWSIDKDSSPYLRSSQSTGFFADRLTQVVTTPVEIETAVDKKWVRQGDHVTSTFSLTPEHRWPKTTTNELVQFKVNGSLYGPYDRPQETGSTPDAAKAVASTSVIVDDSGPHTSPAVELPNNGYYSWVWSLDPADQPTAEAGKILAAQTSSPFFAAGSYHIGRMELRLDTKVTRQHIDPGENFETEVTARLANPENLWLHDESGRKVQVRADGTLYGHYGTTPAAQSAVPELAPVHAHSQVVFDAPGTKTVSTDKDGRPITSEKDGAYSWVWRADPAQQAATDGVYMVGYQSPFFAATSITHVKGTVGMTAVARDDSGDLVGQAGENVSVHYTVVNTSNTKVCDFGVNTSRFGRLGASAALGEYDGCIDPGEMVVLVGKYRVTEQDVEARDDLLFDGTVEGVNVNGVPIIGASAQARLVVDQSARGDEVNALQLTQSYEIVPNDDGPQNRSYDVAIAGDELIYTFKVKNAGKEQLSGVAIDTAVDLETTDWDGHLEPGEIATIYSVHVPVTAADVQAGQIVNGAYARGEDMRSQPVVSNWAVVNVPTSATPVIIETGEGAGRANLSIGWLGGGAGLLLIAGGLLIAGWDRGRRERS